MADRANGGMRAPADLAATLGWREDELRAILKGLGFTAAAKADPSLPDVGQVWRRRAEPEFRVEHRSAPPHSPFAALATLRPAVAPRRPRRRKVRTA